jgi:hypothetical protein
MIICSVHVFAILKFENILLHKIYNKGSKLYYNEINLKFADESSNKTKYFQEATSV